MKYLEQISTIYEIDGAHRCKSVGGQSSTNENKKDPSSLQKKRKYDRAWAVKKRMITETLKQQLNPKSKSPLNAQSEKLKPTRTDIKEIRNQLKGNHIRIRTHHGRQSKTNKQLRTQNRNRDYLKITSLRKSTNERKLEQVNAIESQTSKRI